MHRSRTTKLILLAGSATLLQGCVAAVVPFAAGGLMGGSTLTRGSGDGIAEAPAAADPSVTVGPPAQQAAMPVPEEPAALTVAETTSEAVGTMAPPAALAEPEPSPAPAPPTEEPVAAIVAIDPDAAETPSAEATFAQAFEAAPTSPVEPEVIAEPTTVPEPVAETALAEAPAATRPASNAPLRVIAVDRQAAFADSSTNTSSVSAAQAAAALTNVAPAEEPVSASPALARTPREPEPAPAPTSAPTAALAVNTEAAAAAPALPPSARPAPVSEPVPEPARSAPRPMATGEFAALINYANRQQSRSAQNRASAVLADRASLQPDRAACNGAEATVLIDLDPEGDTFDPTNVRRAAPGLASALAQLRTAGVKIAWISANPLNQISSIRSALNRTGLDIENADELLLMRYPEDRKQTRREDLAESSCLVAIAGDARTDFDELFEYLLNPQAAATLDPLMGNGWFIIPSPLTTERPNP